MIPIIQKRTIWLGISGLVVLVSLAFILMFGLRLGIDFTGGSLLEVKFSQNRPVAQTAQEALEPLGLESLVVQPIGEDGMIFRFKEINEEKHQEILKKLNELSLGGTVEEQRFDSVGPSIGAELKRRSITAIVLVLLGIVIYIGWSFRKVSKPIESYKYGLVAILALFHDVLITIGVYAFLGRYYGVEVNTPFVAAILTVLGCSVNDTIVVFDRIRENLPKSNEDFEHTINRSVNETLGRSINTSFTTLITLLAILFFGGESIRYFVLALAVGIFVGIYSSIFVASPVLVIWNNWKERNG